MPLSVKLLGPLAVEVDGGPLVVDTRKAHALIALLAAAGEPQPRRALAVMLWPETDEDHAFGALRRTLSVLRSALGDRWVEARNGDVALDGPDLDVDLVRERDAWRRLGEHDGQHAADAPCRVCIEALETIVTLHRGPFLAGFALRDSAEFDDWQAALAREAERRLATALERLARAYAANGCFDDALATSDRRLALDPLDEATYRDLMRLHAGAGDRAGAVRRYRECVRVLDRELSVEPLPETTALYRAIVAGELREPPAPPSTAPASVPPAPRAGPIPLVGREDTLAGLVATWESAKHGRAIVLEGEPGIGKTRLADELSAIAAAEGALVVRVACFPEDAGVPYAIAIELLRRFAVDVPERFAELPPAVRLELARLVPELAAHGSDEGAAAGSDDAARARFIEALGFTIRTLAEPSRGSDAPTLLVVDGAQWLDASTADLLVRVARRIGSSRLLLLFCRRPVPPEADGLSPLLASGVRAIRLERLDRRQVGELARFAGLPESEVDALFRASEGVPLYLAERLSEGRAAFAGPVPGHDAPAEPVDAVAALRGVPDTAMPPAIRQLVEARFAVLSEPARQVLGAAAVLGRSFSSVLVQRVSGRSEDETVAALDELVAAGIVREGSGGDEETYEFDHPRTRDAAYARLGVARRRLLHTRAASALRHAGPAAPAPGGAAGAMVVARHYLSAGEEGEAAALLVEAGADAERIFANREAMTLYEAAIALDPALGTVLRERMAAVATLLGRYDDAIRHLEAALASSAPAAPSDVSRLEHKLGSVHVRRGEWTLAEMHLAAALELLAGPSPEHARVLLDQAFVAHRTGDEGRAASLAEAALTVAEALADRELLAEAYNVSGMLAKHRGELAVAERHLRRSLELAVGPAALQARAAALNNLALVEGVAGHSATAIELTEAALRIAVQVGDRHREAALRNNLGDLLHAAGRTGQARQQVRESVAILAELGRTGELNPEVWRLVEW